MSAATQTLNEIAHPPMQHRALRRKILMLVSAVIFAIALPLAPTGAWAADPIYTSFLNNSAAGGYDVVSYFQEGGPKKGTKNFKTEHMGANWFFTSQENLDAFVASPEKYAPQYGGYCAYAAAINQTAKGDPLQWEIVDDKLYLNINKSIKKKWLGMQDEYIEQADKNWPSLLDN